nr:clostripain-related cysteine peptidase [bacterium]
MSNIKPSFQKIILILFFIIFTVSRTCFGETVQISLNADIPAGKIYQGDINATVMSLNLSLSGGAAVADTITYFGVKNTGTMTDGADVSKISAWYDNGTSNNNWDAGDARIGDLTWNAGLSGWDTSNCVIPLIPSVTTRIIITISVNAAATIGRTFTAQVPHDSVVCISGDSGPSSNVTNTGTKTVSVLQLEMGKITDIPSGNVYPSSINNTVMILSLSGAANVAADTVKVFAVKNLGNMDNNDVDTVSLWYDSNGNNQWNSGDAYINSLSWQGSGIWGSNDANIVLASGSAKVLITITMKSSLTENDSFQAQIASYSCSSVLAGTGPQTAIINSGIKTAARGKKWTFMVYLDGDNNLEPDALDDFAEMAAVGSNDDFNIVIQFDRISGEGSTDPDWTNTNRFYITNGMTPLAANAISDWGDGTGAREVNMADTQIFLDFMNWTKTNYPADSYFLVMWNHGGGWRSRSGSSTTRNKALLWDDSSNGEPRLRMPDMRRTIEQTGIKFDIIGFDVCLAGMIEVAYELKELAPVVVASPLSEPGGGWPYTEVLTYLKNNPATTSEAFASKIVDEYNNSYSSGPVTQSAFRIGNINAFRGLIDDFSEKMISANIWSDIKTARLTMTDESTGEMGDGDDGDNSKNTGIDLKTFALKLSGKEVNLTTSINNLSSGLTNFLINFQSKDAPNHTGLAIFFPAYINNPTHKYAMKFGQESKWDEFLRMYWSNETGKGPYGLSMTPLSDSSITGNYYVGWSGAKDANGINKFRLKEYKDAQLFYSDGAENGLSGWTNTGFSVTGRYKNSGSYSFASGEAYSSTRKITKSITLPAGKNYLLTYWIFNDAGGDAVSVKVNGSSKKSYSSNMISEPYETVDLSSYAGQTISLEFSVVFNTSLGWDGEGIFIDDVNIWSYSSVSTLSDAINSSADSYYLSGQAADAYMYTIAASDGTNWSNEYGFDTIVVVGLNIDTFGVIVSDSIMRTQQNATVS